MKRLVLSIMLVFVLGALAPAVLAADLPVVRQPSDAAYSAADRAALTAALADIAALLRPGFSVSRLAQLSGLPPWGEAENIQFVAGTLQSAGYPALLATGSWDGGASRIWVLATVSLPGGVGYVPVEAAPAFLASSAAIGQIAWQGGVERTSFDSRYLHFSQAVPLAPNSPPAVSLSMAERYAIVDETTTLQVMGTDSDSGILGYVWTISDGTTIVDPRATLWYTFRRTGDTTVSVVVLDTRGARTALSERIEVLAERPDCGCGKG